MIRAGIDIGAGSLRLLLEKEGLVFDEPCLVALDKRGEALAIGNKAYELKSLADEDVRVIAPLDQEPVDFDALDALLEELCYEFRLFRLFQKTSLLVAYPAILPESVTDLLKEHLQDLGAEEVYFDQEIWIAGIGAGLDLFLPVGTCVMNIGWSNCDIALFRAGQVVERQSSDSLNGRSAGELIRQYLQMQHNIAISDAALDTIIREIGNVRFSPSPKALEIRGMNLTSKQFAKAIIDENQVATALSPMVREWASWIDAFAESLDEQGKEDLQTRGIVACGGCLNIAGLAESLQTLTGLPVHLTDAPASTVCTGLEKLLVSMKEMEEKE